MAKSCEGSLCLHDALACVQWKEAGDRKREDILCRKWFQASRVALSHKLQKLLHQVNPPSPPYLRAGGAPNIFLMVLVMRVK